jgi:ABC-type transport system involved in multi-copper enzyme maturation permease subunit
MREMPSFIDTVGALARGYSHRLFQARGWALAGLIIVPVAVALLVLSNMDRIPPMLTALNVYHNAYATTLVPILALVSAPACIREDIEQRALPLMLVRPAPIWALPFGKGLLWFAWCSIWLALAVALMAAIGMDASTVPQKILALLLTFWAQLGIASLFLMVFKRGTLWAAIFFFFWDPLVRVFPAALQRLTFTHYVESIAGSRFTKGNVTDILAQEQISSPIWLAAIVLVAVGALAWGLCGLKLMNTPIGLAGSEAEG